MIRKLLQKNYWLLATSTLFIIILCSGCSDDGSKPIDNGNGTNSNFSALEIEFLDGNVNLRWADLSNDVKYEVYRSSDNAVFDKIQTVKSNFYTDSSSSEGNNYYKVSAVSPDGRSATSDVAKIDVPEVLFWIPDVNFRSALKKILPKAFNTDDYLKANSSIVRNFIGKIDVSGKNIANLSGIEKFSGLRDLDCRDNKLISLDISGNLGLMSLNCDNNKISSLDVSKNSNLVGIFCNINELTTLDISKNLELEYLGFHDNKLQNIDLSSNTKLKSLGCGKNQLTVLDLAHNPVLERLYCDNNRLTSVDISVQTSWAYLSFNSYVNPPIDSKSSNAGDEMQRTGNNDPSDNPIALIKVNNSQKQNSAIMNVKYNRGLNVTIAVYETNSSESPLCNNYNPTFNMGDGACLDI